MATVHLEQITDEDLPVRFGRYELQSVLGEGGMARVFCAELHGPAGFRKQVALKVLKADSTAVSTRADIKDVIHEACLGGRLKHPNLVDVYELGEVDGRLFISMELVDGVALNRLVRMGVPIPPSVLLEISIAITAGLAKAHGLEGDDGRVGLVHRDIKPHNILLSWDGAIKIGDFGAAITRRDVTDLAGSVVRNVCGTPSYMSPEQVRGKVLDGRSDLFSLALVISAMILGENPLRRQYVLNRITAGEDLPVPLLSETLIEELNQAAPGIGPVLLGCLEPDRYRRTASAEHLMRDLRSIQDRVGHNPRLSDWLTTVVRGDDTYVLWQNTVQLAEAGIPADAFDELKTVVFASSSGARTNLSPQLDDYVGRMSELTALGNVFDEGVRLVTLKGTGGAGKTRLSHRFAQTQVDALEGGAWFVDLTEARTAKGVVHATALALEVPLGGGDFDGLVTQMGYAIAGRGPVLIVLDNFEQVIDHAVDTVGRWQTLAPEARFLVTSRESLRLSGEHIFALGSLSDAEGSVLFELRARAAGAEWLETAEVRDAVTSIVQQLDGLPLAIELAAARANVLSPVQIHDRLSHRFELLRTGTRGRTKRQSSLRGLIDWSWDLLEPWEQSALAQLSVFHDGFSMDACEGVLDLAAWPHAPWSMDVVGSLLDKSLLHSRDVRGHRRLFMYVSIQEYAEYKLGSKRRETALRHAQFFARYGTEEYIDSIDTHGGVGRFQQLIVELENLLAGVQECMNAKEVETAALCAKGAAEVFQLRGPTEPGLELLESILRLPINGSTRIRILRSSGQLLRHAGRWVEARDRYMEGLGLARESGDKRFEGILLARLGWLSLLQARADESLEHYRRALPMHRETGDRASEGATLGRLAWLHYRQGRISEALEYFPQALAVHRELGNRKSEGVQLGNLALMLSEQGRIDEALEYYQRALSIHRDIGNRRAEGGCMANLGILHAQQGRMQEAKKHYERALSINRVVGNRRGVARITGNLANLLVEFGHPTEAREHYEHAMSIYREMEDLRGLGENLGNYGDFLFESGDLESAERCLNEAIECSRKVYPLCVGAFSASLALLRAHQGSIDAAYVLLEEGEPLVRGVHQVEFGKFLCKRARVDHAANNPGAAKEAFQEAEKIADELDLGPDSELMRYIEKTRLVLRIQ